MKITLTKDTATPHLRRLLEQARSPRTARTLLGAGSKAVQVGISRHLRALQARGNAKGWPSQKFFAGKATSVEKTVGVSGYTDHSVTVSIADPRFVHRLQGGTVKAKRSKYLAIPLTAEAYALSGKGSLKQSAPGLQIVRAKRGIYLARPEGSASTGRMVFLFKLVPTVTHSPHPEEAPDENALAAAGLAGMETAAQRLLA